MAEAPPCADGHELMLRYQLPVPFALYLYACAATLIVTFALLGWFMKASRADPARVALRSSRSGQPARIQDRQGGLARP